MSKLEELIRELCPDGVEYVPLSEVAHYSKSRIHASEVDESTYVGVENLLQNKQGKSIANSVPTSGTVIAFNCGDILIGNIRPYLKKIWLADCNGGTNGDVLTIRINEQEKLNSKFLYYVLSSDQFFLYDVQNSKGAKMPRGSKEAVMMYPIPIPPLPVQREIIRILDNFTELTAELQEKLTTEVAARKKQYEYYLDQFYGGTYEEMLLLEKRTGWKILPLSGIGTFTRGKRFVKADSEGLEDGVPCIHYGELYTYYGVSAEKSKSFVPVELAQKLRYAHKGDVVIVGAGENNIDIGVGVAWFGEDVVVHDACYIFKHKLNPKYLSYFLRTTIYHNQIKKYVSEGKICSISAQGLGKAIIPVPPMEEQKRIVSILDRFDTLCNDLTSGLPAEIEARQKQYEYYRDKLLSFKELIVN